MQGGGTAGYGLLLLLASLALVLIGLAIYLYREQTRELRQAAQKVEFVGQVSHELKTPLTNIRMYAEMLEDQVDDDPQQQGYLKVIINESQRLSRLIGNVLNFSRTPQLHLQHVDIDTLVKQTLDHFLPGYQSRGIEVHTDLQARSSVESDHDMLEQILNNLFSNVEKYAAEGKRVDVVTRQKDNQLIITVRDYGPGIPASEHRKIFEAFYRINNGLTEGVSGTGIGLTIARQQAQRLGGELVLIEVSPGACFELCLPITKESGQ
jgi:signal transduction histidine kinase